MISTNGRYALQVMTDLAQHSENGFIKLEYIAKRLNLSESYLHNIMSKLSRAGLIDGKRGARGGGIRLTKAPKEYTVAEILTAAGEKLAPIACLLPDAAECPRASRCPTRQMWEEFGAISFNYLNSKTLAEVARIDSSNLSAVSSDGKAETSAPGLPVGNPPSDNAN